MSLTPEMIELVNATVPKNKERKRTLFDLSGTAHDELVFTRWYEYFLDKNEDHGLSDLFLQTLLTITRNKLSISDFGVGRNVQTKKGNYVDLFIFGQGDDVGKSVIIENKIYHCLDNDLVDYWDDAPGPDSNKLGILLTLNPHHIPPTVQGKFMNVIHQEWLGAVMDGCASFTLTHEQRNILEHFHNAIINLSKDLIMNEQVLFFLNNIQAVNDILATKQKAREYILAQLDSAGAQLGYKVGSGNSDYYRTFKLPQESDIYYTILFHELLATEQKLRIRLEMKGEVLKRVEELDSILSLEITEATKKGMSHCEVRDGHWLEYLGLSYEVNRETMSNLAEFIVQKVNEDFSEITRQVVEVLNSEKTGTHE
jgi:hypothetical protein